MSIKRNYISTTEKLFKTLHYIFKDNKNNIQDISLYLIASFIPLFANVTINPFVALNMSPEDYSIVGYYTSFNLLFKPIITFSLISYYIKRYFELSESERIGLKANVFKSLIYISFFISLICLGFLYFYHSNLNSKSQIEFFPYAFLSVLSLPLSGVYALKLAESKMKKSAFTFFKFSVGYGMVSIVFTLILVVWIKFGAFGKLSAVFISNVLIFVVIILNDKESFKEKFDWSIFKSMSFFCFPLTIAAMLEFFSAGYDKVVLERLGNLEELGLYVVGYQIAGYLGVFSVSIDNTFQPDLYKKVINRDRKGFLKIVTFKLLLIILVVLFFILIAPFLINILTYGRYVGATKYARVISISVITKSIFYVFSVLTIALGLTYITLINKIISSILSFLLITYLVHHFSFKGAAWGIVFAYLILAISNLIILLYIRRGSYVFNKIFKVFKGKKSHC